MTGGTLIIVSGKSVVLGKVRHDGFLVPEWLAANDPFTMPFDQIWHNLWTKEFNEAPDDKLTSFVDDCFIYHDSQIARPTPNDITELSRFMSAIEGEATVKAEAADTDPYGAMGCSYSDYQNFIDYDNKMLYDMNDIIHQAFAISKAKYKIGDKFRLNKKCEENYYHCVEDRIKMHGDDIEVEMIAIEQDYYCWRCTCKDTKTGKTVEYLVPEWVIDTIYTIVS